MEKNKYMKILCLDGGGAAGVTGLVPTEVLYGASDGTIEQKSSVFFVTCN